MLIGAMPVSSFKSMVFKKKITTLCTYYGLYDSDRLVAYFWFLNIRTHDKAIKGYEFHVVEDQRRNGIGTFFYEHIVLVDQYTIVTDYSHTVSSSKLWIKLRTLAKFKVGTYDAITDTFEWKAPSFETVYDNDHMHFAVRSCTMEDINVDEANKITTEIVLNTTRKHATNRLTTSNDMIVGICKPLSLEL
jgi:hypothetical protein